MHDRLQRRSVDEGSISADEDTRKRDTARVPAEGPPDPEQPRPARVRSADQVVVSLFRNGDGAIVDAVRLARWEALLAAVEQADGEGPRDHDRPGD